uniref:F-box domain-containing protein n=1 Tax=Ditylenchus dipsaci TaxID=166011 RepID=A0A915DFM9_9BILA
MSASVDECEVKPKKQRKPKKNKHVCLSTEVLCDVFVLLNRTKLIILSRVNRQFFYAIDQNLSFKCLLIKHMLQDRNFACSSKCVSDYQPTHCWYVCNSLKIKVPVLEKKYVRFKTTKLNLEGPKTSSLAFLRRLYLLKHLWDGQILKVTTKFMMDSDFISKCYKS